MRKVDIVVRNGVIYDGSGDGSYEGDVAIQGDRIWAVGEVGADGREEIDAAGLAIAPGFINMMCWANESLIHDGRSQSDIRQGVTLEVLGEGWSMGPLNEELKSYMKGRQSNIQYEIEWTTLDEYLRFLVRRGVSTNVASFVGAGIARTNVLGFEDRPPTAKELGEMQRLLRQAMAEGALGVSSALIYTPDSYAGHEELTALAEVAAEYDGIYISHLRSEGSRFLEALDEFLGIVERSGARGEIYHLKAAGQRNWHKLEQAIKRIEATRAGGLPVTADIYTYTASSSGLDWLMPGWVQEGGHAAWIGRLKDPSLRQRVIDEMSYEGDDVETPYQEVGSPENVLFTSFRSSGLQHLAGKTLADAAAERGKPAIDTVIDLVVEDDSRVGAMFFSMSPENLRKKVALPWISFCSDSASMAPEGVFLNSHAHPRAYGSFARVLGKFVREEKIISLAEAIRRLSALPAEVLKLNKRGRLREGYYADVVIFDADSIQDHATFTRPHQYTTGMVHVFVNGSQVLRDGEHTGDRPGRVVRGPGWQVASGK